MTTKTPRKTASKTPKKGANALLLNWPPSRGPMPAWMRKKPVYVVPEPKIELLERGAKPPRRIRPPAPPKPRKPDGRTPGHMGLFSIDLRHERSRNDAVRTWSYDVCQHVETVASLTLDQAKAAIHGIDKAPHFPPGFPKSLKSKGPRLGSILPRRTLVFDITYPLGKTARVTIEPYAEKSPRSRRSGHRRPARYMDLGYVLWQLARAYRKVYRQHRRYGVWGHAIGDLWFEGLRVDDNLGQVDIGS